MEIFRGNNELSHWDKKHVESYSHIGKQYEEFCPGNWESFAEESDQACVIAILRENKEAINNKSLIDIGCAHGGMAWHLKTNVIPDWRVVGSDFSTAVINENRKRSSEVEWEQRDVLANPLTEDYGVVTCLQTIEHFQEGLNYKFIDNVLEHCEYLILATVDTVDNCFGEHISFYTIDTMDEKGYDVQWKSKLGAVNSPDGQLHHCIIFMIKGKL